MRILILTGPSEGLKFGVDESKTKKPSPRQLKEIIICLLKIPSRKATEFFITNK